MIVSVFQASRGLGVECGRLKLLIIAALIALSLRNVGRTHSQALGSAVL